MWWRRRLRVDTSVKQKIVSVFVKSAVPVLAPLLRSDAQGELLALLFLHPEDEYSLSEIARLVRVSLPTIHAEVGRLAAAGLVLERRLAQARLVRANADQVLARPLTELLELTYGPTAVLPDILAGLPGARAAYIYGSWAARRLGEPGPAPRDIDVVVVGTTSRAVLAEAAEQATHRLHREVNLTKVSPATWDTGRDPFVKTLTSRPLVPVHPAGDRRPAREGDQ
jgi:DNA-binding transcriptional ArsR family regulator